MSRLVEKMNCERCGTFIYNVDRSTRYCKICKPKVNKDHWDNNRYKKRLIKHIELDENFHKVMADEKYAVFMSEFDRISRFPAKSYIGNFSLGWISILKKYGYIDLLYQSIDELAYQKYTETYRYHSLRKLGAVTGYFDDVFATKISKDNKQRVYQSPFLSKPNLTKGDIDQRFRFIVKEVGYIPFWGEYSKYGNATVANYAKVLGCKPAFSEVVKELTTPEEYEEFVGRFEENRINNGLVNGKKAIIYSFDELKENFHYIVEFCKQTYKQYPSLKLFSKVSNIDGTTYKNRLKMTWEEVYKYYGYDVDEVFKSGEKTLLNIIKRLTNCEYIPQKQFSWLRSVKNYPLYCDGYFPELNLVVEFDGKQHREPLKQFGGKEKFESRKINDATKDTLIPQNGLKLIRITSDSEWYDESFISKVLEKHNIPFRK